VDDTDEDELYGGREDWQIQTIHSHQFTQMNGTPEALKTCGAAEKSQKWGLKKKKGSRKVASTLCVNSL